jgi:hypothetical protein
MIECDENGDRWLLCDLCSCEEPRHYWSNGMNAFYGIGLENARLVRMVARDLEGWRRRRLITHLEPFSAAYFFSARHCQQPEVLASHFR